MSQGSDSMTSEGRLELARRLIRGVIRGSNPRINPTGSVVGTLFSKHSVSHCIDLARECGVSEALAALPDSAELSSMHSAQWAAARERRKERPATNPGIDNAT